MRTTKLAAAFSLGVTLASTSAFAAGNVGDACKSGNPCVYDGNWRVVGLARDIGIVHHQAWWLWLDMGYNKRGFVADFWPVFLTKNCTGQPYIDAGYIDTDGATPVTNSFTWGRWDGQAIWAPMSDAEAIVPQSQLNTDGSCQAVSQPLQPYTSAYAPAVKIEIPGFVPPFQVR